MSATGQPPSYAEFADIWRTRPDISGDPSFAIRALRQSVLHAQSMPSGPELDWFHREPAPTGVLGWDALLAGVAVFTGAGRVSAGTLDWCRAPGRWSRELFDPLGVDQKYLLLESLRTPAALRERNVILAIGNLQGL
ncbi:hypothetical protein [Gordonia malaquae]|uniref:hypothetical protein n=1 Tax=Gordonia malaquae TaxID=410332 RepID=UPI0030193977